MATNLETPVTHGPRRGLPLTSGSRLTSSFASSLSFAGSERIGVDIFHLARQIAQIAVGVDEAGFFLAGGAIAYEFHAVSCSVARLRLM
jgi:hypothetical protein